MQHMIDRQQFEFLFCKFAKVPAVSDNDVIFGGGINLSSIGFTEFIMELEEVIGRDIDIDDLDASVRTVGQLYARLNTG